MLLRNNIGVELSITVRLSVRMNAEISGTIKARLLKLSIQILEIQMSSRPHF